ncbi:MAG: 5-formyltetrahydrofolate cyclo-ligase [Kineosporiaceae bacterium]
MAAVQVPGAARSARSRPPEPADRIRAAKAALRAVIRREQRMRSDEERRTAACGLRDVFLELPHLRWVGRVVLYEPRDGQIDTRPLRIALAARGIPVLFPTITLAGGVSWRVDTMALPGAPSSGTEPGEPGRWSGCGQNGAIVLVPAMAVDTLGRRLGRGCDGYDRFLREIGPSTLVLCGVDDSGVFDAAVEPVPAEAHDMPVDAVITPSHLLYLH